MKMTKTDSGYFVHLPKDVMDVVNKAYFGTSKPKRQKKSPPVERRAIKNASAISGHPQKTASLFD